MLFGAYEEIIKKDGSEQESLNTCVFARFLSCRLVGSPMPPYIDYLRYRQCFQTFCDTFHSLTWYGFFLLRIP